MTCSRSSVRAELCGAEKKHVLGDLDVVFPGWLAVFLQGR